LVVSKGPEGGEEGGVVGGGSTSNINQYKKNN